MYTPLIGRRLLDRANARDGCDRTPAEFFTDVFHPVVFGHEDYLMPAGNSKFGQLSNWRKKQLSAAKREGKPETEPEHEDFRTDALADFHVVATETSEPFMHLVAGGYAEDTSKTTSGQVTSIDHVADADDTYLSWIGVAAGVRVGKLVLLIDHDEILDAVLNGWALYRRILTETPGIKANQLETWNGHWLRHRFSALYDPDDPVAFVRAGEVVNTKKTPSELTTVPWARLLLSLGRAFGDASVPAYVYSTGRMNTTVGFIRLDLGATGALRDSYSTLRDFYRGLFGDAVDAVGEDRLDWVYEAGQVFGRVCEEGTIGLRAFEPHKLRDFLPGGKKDRQPKPVGPADAQMTLLYQTWIHAMLGDQKDTLYARANSLAERLLDFETGAIGGKTNLKKSVKEALKSSSLEAFIAGLTQIAEDIQDASKADLSDDEVAETLDALDAVVRESLSLDYERFRLFLALLRFQVALLRGRAAHASEPA
jgi:hypothetical protein